MSPIEAVLVWITLGLYGITSAAYIYCIVFRNYRLLSRISLPIGAALVVHTAAIAARYAAVGNLPTGGDYENAFGLTWIITAFTFYVSLRHKQIAAAGVATMTMSLILLGYGVMSGPVLAPMPVTVKTFWLYIHVFFAWLAFGAYAVAFGLGVIYLLKERKPDDPFYAKFPSLPRIDDLMFRYIVFGFITDAVMIAAGAIWAKDLWGKYWSWDPVETWSLVTWVIYGLAIHLRVTMGWKGRRLAWITIFALSGMIITYFGINFIVKESMHVFEVWREM